MESGEKVSIQEVLTWQAKKSEGFHGILTDPRGERGFLSKIGGSTSWTPIGEGQDDTEVLTVAKKLHDAMSSSRKVDSAYLDYLGREVERLSKPKPKE